MTLSADTTYAATSLGALTRGIFGPRRADESHIILRRRAASFNANTFNDLDTPLADEILLSRSKH
eukprot:1215775-Rhodomonas_salina.1